MRRREKIRSVSFYPQVNFFCDSFMLLFSNPTNKLQSGRNKCQLEHIGHFRVVRRIKRTWDVESANFHSIFPELNCAKVFRTFEKIPESELENTQRVFLCSRIKKRISWLEKGEEKKTFGQLQKRKWAARKETSTHTHTRHCINHRNQR